MLVPYLLFGLERYDGAIQSIRSVGGVVIAMETPAYVGRLMIGAEAVEDKSDLIISGRPTVALFLELQTIGEGPGAEVTNKYPELWALFSDPEMTERGTIAAFLQHDRSVSYARRPERYERILRQFVLELAARNG